MMRSPLSVLALLAVAAILLPSSAATDRITLRLEKVTCREALLALQRAAGVPLELNGWEAPDEAAERPALRDVDQRASFAWQAAPLGDALRAVAERYALVCTPRPGGGFSLRQTGESPPRYASTVAAEVRGIRLEVREVRVTGTRPGAAPGELLTLRLHAKAAPGTPVQLLGIENLVARDDRGGVLLTRRPLPFPYFQRTYPDEWSAYVQFSGLQPGATRLVSLEGDLVTDTTTEVQRCEIPLPVPADGSQRRLRNLLVEVRELVSAPPPGAALPEARQETGPVLRMRVTAPAEAKLVAANGVPGAVPTLLGASGRTYAPRSLNASYQLSNEIRVTEVEARYRPIEEPLAAMRLEVAARRGPTLGGTFRISGIPLPGATAGAAGLLPPGVIAFQSPDPANPELPMGGGSLSSKIRIGGRAAPPGQLAVGLASATEPGPRHWYEAPVGPDGGALLRGLPPGDYHVVRAYRPQPAADLPPGAWMNAVSRVRIEAGEEARLPTLELTNEDRPMPQDPAIPPEETAETRIEDAAGDYLRTLELLQPPVTRSDGALTLKLTGAVGGIPTDRVYGLRSVIACDDRGNLLVGSAASDIRTEEAGQFQGLTWRQSVKLGAPHRLARSLAWLEGALYAYGNAERALVELPVPPPGGARWERGPVSIELVSLQQGFAALIAAKGPDVNEYLLHLRAEGPDGTRYLPRRANRHPILVGRSGNDYAPIRSNDAEADGRWDTRCWYHVPEPVEKVRLDLNIQTELEPVLSFRLRNVPLPEAQPFVPPVPVVPPRTVIAPPPPRLTRVLPFFSAPDKIDIPGLRQEGGATLILPVRQGDHPAADGTLLVGLSRKSAAGWAAPRWTEIEVSRGVGRLEDIKPGTYRLSLHYRRTGAGSEARPQVPAIQVTLTAGKQSTAPPLRLP